MTVAVTNADGGLVGGGFAGVDFAALSALVPTPFYAYSANALSERVTRLQAAFSARPTLICYAVKANGNLALLRQFAAAGIGADIVSVGELQRALRAGIAPARIVFSGVGKTATEVREALRVGILRFNIESSDELELLDACAREQGIVAAAALRINPDIDAATHGKISTGRSGNKFGIDLPAARCLFARAAQYANVQLDGLHVHIGSQILSEGPLIDCAQAVAEFRRELAAVGVCIRSIDMGGGLGVCYRAGHEQPVPVERHAEIILDALADFSGQLLLEPGRHLVAEAGVLITRVIRVKQGPDRNFLIVDAAMNDLLRPTLYEAWHDIVPLHPRGNAHVRYDIVGPVCESGDTFAFGRELPRCEAGDLVAILGAGAYAASMASTYNSRPLLAEVMIDRDAFAVIRRAQSIDEMLALESVTPLWQPLPAQANS